MATYTTTQAGAWNTAATWGGSGYPNANNDIVVIEHPVTYNRGVSETTFGNVTVNSGGLLIFPVDSSWKILFNATGILTINSGGEIRTGTTSNAAEIGAAYLGQIHFPQGSTARYTFVLNDGGIINLWGADIYQPTNRYVYLDSDWTTGSTLYITGDITSKTCWAAGNMFYIHDNADAYATNGYQVQGDIYTISSIGSYDSGNDRTPIVVTASNPDRTCYAVSTPGVVSKLILISRNLQLCDPAAPLTVYGHNSYTENIRFDNNQIATNSLINFKNCVFSGWDKVCDSGHNFNGDGLSFISNNYGLYTSIHNQITGDFISNNYCINACTNNKITGDIISNNAGFISSYTSLWIGNFISNNTSISNCNICKVIGDFISNGAGISSGINNQITGNFISNNFSLSSGINNQITGSFTNNNTNIVNIVNISASLSIILESCTFGTSSIYPIMSYQNSGNVLSLLSGESGFISPPSGNSWIMQVIPNSYCEQTYARRVAVSVLKSMAYYAATGSQTLTFKIYPLAYTSSLDQDDVRLEVMYLDTATGITRATVYNTSQTYAIDGWRDCSVTFTPAQAGIVYFNLFIGKYEAGATILIDPVWTVD